MINTRILTQVTARGGGEISGSMLEFGRSSEEVMVLAPAIGRGESLMVRATTARFDVKTYQVIDLRGGIATPAELL